jgi:hypothetical protein
MRSVNIFSRLRQEALRDDVVWGREVFFCAAGRRWWLRRCH